MSKDAPVAAEERPEVVADKPAPCEELVVAKPAKPARVRK